MTTSPTRRSNSHLWTLVGFCHVAFVIDVFSRRIRLARHHQQAHRHGHRRTPAGLAGAAVQTSDPGRRRAGPLLRCRIPYVSLAWTVELLDAGVAGSIGTVDDVWHHALCDLDDRLVQTEALDRAGPAQRDRHDATGQVARWVHCGNSERRQSSIGHLLRSNTSTGTGRARP